MATIFLFLQFATAFHLVADLHAADCGEIGASSCVARKPNILLFLVDDLGWSDVHYNGAEFSTPNIDRLSSEGVRFDQYYVEPVCSPARAALLSGRYPFRDGLAHTVITNGFRIGLPPAHRTLADELRSAGYSTHIAGKWDLGMSSWNLTPTFRGFDTFLGFYNAFEDHYTHTTFAVPGILGTYMIPNTTGLDLRDGVVPEFGRSGAFSTDLYTRRLKKIISTHNFRKAPLFLYAALQVVHSPLEAPLRYFRRCAGVRPLKRRLLCAMAKTADDSLGELENALKARGQWKNTLLLFMTDNGGQTSQGSSNWPLRAGKMTVYEGGVRGLAFARGAMLKKTGYVNHELIHTVDWFPTLLEGVVKLKLNPGMAGLQKIDGVNQWDTIAKGEPSCRKEVLLQLDPAFSNRDSSIQKSWIGQAALRVGEWKLIAGEALCREHPLSTRFHERCDDGWFMANGTRISPPKNISLVQLFNIAEDPYEKRNLATVHPTVVKMLWRRLKKTYLSQARQQQLPDYDPRSNVANFGGVWTPWLTD